MLSAGAMSQGSLNLPVNDLTHDYIHLSLLHAEQWHLPRSTWQTLDKSQKVAHWVSRPEPTFLSALLWGSAAVGNLCSQTARTVPPPSTSPLTCLITRWVSRTRSVVSADLHLNRVTAWLLTLFWTVQAVKTSRSNDTLQTMSIQRKICVCTAFFYKRHIWARPVPVCARSKA